MDEKQQPMPKSMPNELLVEMVYFVPLPKCQKLMENGPIKNWKFTKMIKPRANKAQKLIAEYQILQKGVERMEREIADLAFGCRITGGLYENIVESGQDRKLFAEKYKFSKPMSQFMHSWQNGWQMPRGYERRLELLDKYNADYEMLVEGKIEEMPQWNYF